MTLFASAALQEALFAHLSADPEVTALIGAAIYDAPPSGPAPDLYLLIGAEAQQDIGDGTGTLARHDITLSVVGAAPGFAALKSVAAAVTDCLTGADPSLAAGQLVSLRLRKSRALRVGTAQGRRIDLTFRALVDLG